MTHSRSIWLTRYCWPAFVICASAFQVRDDVKTEVAQLVAESSPTAIERLNEIGRSNVPEDFELASRGLVTIAQSKFLAGDMKLAYRLANNIWLSSSANQTRIDAWRIIQLCEDNPRIMADGHQIHLWADGGRDHRRFAEWIRQQFVEPNQSVIDFKITYRLQITKNNRVGESLILTFVVNDAAEQDKLLEQVANSRSTFPTHEWKIVQFSPLLGR